MKSPEAVLRNALVTTTAVSAIVGSRVFPVIAPATAALPYITYRRASVQRTQSLSGPIGVPTVTVELDVVAATYEAARGLADKCRQVLDGYGGTFDNTEVKHVSLENESDGFIQLSGGELPLVYSVQQLYNTLWQET